MARGGTQAGVVQSRAELRGGTPDEAGVLDPGVSDLGELGEARLQVDRKLITERVELHADLIARDTAGATVSPRGGGARYGQRSGGSGRARGGGGAEQAAAAE